VFDLLSLVIVMLTGIYFFVLAGLSLFAPEQAKRYLLGFASSAHLHYTELILRIVVGTTFIQHAPRMLFSAGFAVFGWVLIATSVVLLLIPWRWHARFAQRAVPKATQYIGLMGASSLIIGALILIAACTGYTAH
jgi:hypothetical protein